MCGRGIMVGHSYCSWHCWVCWHGGLDDDVAVA